MTEILVIWEGPVIITICFMVLGIWAVELNEEYDFI